jgi:hypothetical protein
MNESEKRRGVADQTTLRSEGSIPPPRAAGIEERLRALGRAAADAAPPGKHVDEPLLALLRDGDQAEDLVDAVAHAARCAACRARLTVGDIERRSVVVMAIEAPRASQTDLQKAADEAAAKLSPRGQGRWAAVVEASKAEKLKGELEKPESSIVSRLAVGTPFEVPVDELRSVRQRLHTTGGGDVPESGTDAAEVQAWVQIARKPRRRDVDRMSPGWILFGVLVVAAAMAVAYWLATR